MFIFKKILLISLCCLLGLSLWAVPKKILIISSYSLEHSWISAVCQEVETGLSHEKYETQLEYLELNALRNSKRDIENKFSPYLKKIQNNEYAVVVAILHDSIKLILDSYDSIPKTQPIIFVAYRDVPNNFKKKYPNISGTGGAYNVRPTMELGLALYPATEEILIISDDNCTGLLLFEALQKDLKDYSRCKVTLLNGAKVSTQEMLDIVAKMPEKSLVIFGPWRQFADDCYISLVSVSKELRKRIQRPYFVLNDTLIGKGALGGYVSIAKDNGQQVLSQIRRIINGENLSNIALELDIPKFMIDMNIFSEERLSRKKLPNDTIIINGSKGYFKSQSLHSNLLVGLLVTFMLLVVWGIFKFRKIKLYTSSVLDYNRVLDQEKNQTLKNQNTILNFINEGIVLTDTNWQITFVNTKILHLLGRSEEELLGTFIDDVLQLRDAINDEELSLSKKQASEDFNNAEIRLLSVNLLGPNDEKHDIECQIIGLGKEDGKLSGFAIYLHDVTLENKQKIMLEENTIALERTLDFMNASCAISKLKKVSYRRTNNKSSNWGYSTDGDNLMPKDWIHPEDLTEFYTKWNLLKERKINEFKIKYRSLHKGEIRYFVMVTKLIIDQKDYDYISIVQDVTAHEQELKQLYDSNKLFNLVIDSLSSYLLVKDANDDYRFLIANKAWCDAVGLQAENVIGKTDFEIFSASDAHRFRIDDREIVENLITKTYNEELPVVDGVFHLKTTKTAFVGHNGTRLLVAIASDITDILKIKKQAEDSKELLRIAFDNAPVGLLLKDPDDEFRYIYWNAQLSRDTHLPISFVEGKTDADWHGYPGHEDYFKIQDNLAMLSNNGVQVEEVLKNHYGEDVHYLTTKRPIVLSSGKRYLFGSFMNIERIKQLEYELKEVMVKQNNLIRNEQIYNECLRHITVEKDFNRAINRILAVIGKKCLASRCFIVCNDLNLSNKMVKFDWISDDNINKISFFEQYPEEKWGNLLSFLYEDKVCRIDKLNNHVDIFNDINESLNNELEDKKTLLCSIENSDNLQGIIGIIRSEMHGEITVEIEDMLHICASLFLLVRESAVQQFKYDDSANLRHNIFDNIKIPIMLFAPNGHLISVNPAACGIAGLSKEQILNRPCYHSFCKNNKVPSSCPVHITLKTHKSCKAEMMFNGKQYMLETEPIFDKQGNLIYVLENAIDISEECLNRQKLNDALLITKAAELAKINFIATMNHEIRTPLNSVLGFAELLQTDGVTKSEMDQYIQSIINSGKTLLGLINDILDLSKLEMDKLDFKFMRVDFENLCHEVIKFAQASADDRNIKIEIVIASTLPYLYLEPSRCRQILFNLMNNAIKFTYMGMIKIEVKFIEKTIEHGDLIVEISDTGIGIADDFLDKIFEPFVQTEEVRASRAYQGSGLGLTISKKLAMAMNGDIRVQSCKNVGSTFTLLLKQVKFVKKRNSIDE